MNSNKLITMLRITALLLFAFLTHHQSANAQFNHWKQNNIDGAVKIEVVKTYEGESNADNNGILLNRATISYSTEGLITREVFVGMNPNRPDSTINDYVYEGDRLMVVISNNFVFHELKSTSYQVITNWSTYNEPLLAIYSVNPAAILGFVDAKDSTSSTSYQFENLRIMGTKQVNHVIDYSSENNEIQTNIYSSKNTYDNIGNMQTTLSTYNQGGSNQQWETKYNYSPIGEVNWSIKEMHVGGNISHSVRELEHYIDKEITDNTVSVSQFDLSKMDLINLSLREMSSKIDKNVDGSLLYWSIMQHENMVRNYATYQDNDLRIYYNSAIGLAMENEFYSIVPKLTNRMLTVVNQYEDSELLKLYADHIMWKYYYEVKQFDQAFELSKSINKKIEKWKSNRNDEQLPSFLNEILDPSIDLFPLKWGRVLFATEQTEDALTYLDGWYKSLKADADIYEPLMSGFASLTMEYGELEWAEKCYLNLKTYYGQDKVRYEKEYKVTIMELISIKKSTSTDE